MTKKIIIALAIYGSIMTILLALVVSTQFWGITHPKQVEMARASFEGHVAGWSLTAHPEEAGR